MSRISREKTEKRSRRQNRIRAKVSGTKERPRLSVFKSNKYISVQLIDDEAGTTIVAATSQGIKGAGAEQAAALGKEVAKLALAKGVKKVVFDRGGYIYTGKIKGVADGAREGGLEF